jgi:hypothetical protein
VSRAKPRSYVSGTGGSYVLHVPQGMPRAVLEQYGWLHGVVFTKYRAAQLLANAINSYKPKRVTP